MSNGVTDLAWQYRHVTADAQVRAGKGILHSITLNGLTTLGDITIYDSLTEGGTVIAVLHLNTAISVSVQPMTLFYDLEFSTGLYIGYDATAAADLTIMYA